MPEPAVILPVDPRRALPFAALFLASCSVPYVDDSSDAMEHAFRVAATETGVPRDLIAAIAFSESRLDGRAGVTDEIGHVGIMGLRDDAATDLGPRLDDAADRVGATESLVRQEPGLQVLGAAQILRDYALEDQGALPTDLQGWWPEVERYSGSDDPAVQASYANQVFQTIESGYIRRTRDGERVELIGRYVPGLFVSWDDRAATDYAGAASFRGAASCNYSDQSRTTGIDRVIIHTTQGSYNGSISWFQDCASHVSAHYVVRSSDGEVTQVVREQDVAWHAGNSNFNSRSVGIELEAYMDNGPAWFTDAMYRSAADLTRDVCDRYHIPKNRAHIIGHNEVPDPDGSGWGGAGHHTDPGAQFDWNYFLQLVNQQAPAEVSAQKGDLIGTVRAGDVQTGAPLAGAVVSLQDGETATTGSDGIYRFYGLQAGAWTVSARAGGYDAASQATQIEADQLSWASFGLAATATNTAPPSEPPPDTGLPGAPVALGPSDTQTGESVRMSWTDTGHASVFHEVELYYQVNGSWVWYYTWQANAQEKAFWPQVRGTKYTFHVRGHDDAGWGEFSGWQEFEVR